MQIYKDDRDNELDRDTWPDTDDLEFWIYDGVCEATDGCHVEPDGTCEHNHQSWLIVMGMI